MRYTEGEQDKKCPQCGQRDCTSFSTCRYCGASYSAQFTAGLNRGKQYSGWQAVYLSFYSTAFYQEVCKCWTGFGYLYLLSLICIVSVVNAIQFEITSAPHIEKTFASPIDQMPTIAIENGHLSIDKPSPYSISIPIEQDPAHKESISIIFDTREKPVDISANVSANQTVVLIGRDNILIPDANKGEAITIDFHSVNNFALDSSSARTMLHSFLQWAAFLIFFVYILQTSIGCFFQTLIYAWIGKLFADNQLSYFTLVKLASVALTPAIVLDRIFRTMSYDIAYWKIISIFIALGYLWFAVEVNKVQKKI